MYSKINAIREEEVPFDVHHSQYERSQCPEGFLDIDDIEHNLPFCFKIFSKKKTWQDAENECKRLRATLATISSSTENNIIYEALKRFELNLNWIGLHLGNVASCMMSLIMACHNKF